MKKYLSIALTLVLFLSACQSALYAQNSFKPVREDKIHLFSLEDVRITDGQFLQVQELDHEYLLTL